MPNKLQIFVAAVVFRRPFHPASKTETLIQCRKAITGLLRGKAKKDVRIKARHSDHEIGIQANMTQEVLKEGNKITPSLRDELLLHCFNLFGQIRNGPLSVAVVTSYLSCASCVQILLQSQSSGKISGG